MNTKSLHVYSTFFYPPPSLDSIPAFCSCSWLGYEIAQVHVFTRSFIQSSGTNVSLGLVMYSKKETFLFFQKIITYEHKNVFF